jgi:precorrin-2 dehydrogenase/sirohydrochlorin ferrochelatase
MSRFFPIYLDIKGKKCVVIGGGQVAERKCISLQKYGVKVTLVAPAVTEKIRELGENGSIDITIGRYDPSLLDGAVLVVGATDDTDVNRAIYETASAKNIPVNIVDNPELCTFIVPSVVERGDLCIAVSTGGKSPAVAREIRKKLDKDFGAEWGEYLDIMGRARQSVLSLVDGQKNRKEIFNRLAESRIRILLAEGKRDEAWKLAEKITGITIGGGDE